MAAGPPAALRLEGRGAASAAELPGAHPPDPQLRRCLLTAVVAMAPAACSAVLAHPSQAALRRTTMTARSVEGRRIEATAIGSGDNAVLLIGGIHGNEASSVRLVGRFKRWASRRWRPPPGCSAGRLTGRQSGRARARHPKERRPCRPEPELSRARLGHATPPQGRQSRTAASLRTRNAIHRKADQALPSEADRLGSRPVPSGQHRWPGNAFRPGHAPLQP